MQHYYMTETLIKIGFIVTDDGKHLHSHENVEILGEIHTSEGVKHIHSHRHSLKLKSHCSKL